MGVTRVLEQSGAQLLPDIRDPRSTYPGWIAHLCADADLRTTSHDYRELAGSLSIHKATGG
jgi:hypothetical protein